MIKYLLKCDRDHEFESWFSSSETFEAQKREQLVECPACASTNIEKALMSPNVATRSKKTRVAAPSDVVPREMAKVFAQAKKMVAQIKKNAEYVGEKFPEEARKIHYKEAETRPIWGKSSAEDVRDLLDEGISVLPLPPSPEDRN